nr:MAG TPA: hypothetical protein [Caudoviricetes sp.]
MKCKIGAKYKPTIPSLIKITRSENTNSDLFLSFRNFIG